MAFKTLSSLKKNSAKSLDKLHETLDTMDKKYSDPFADTYWKLKRDKAGNGMAIIRFLPEPKGEDFPFVRIFDHFFKGVNGWYVEKSLSTLNKPDPLGDFNKQLWNSVSDDDSAERAQVRKQKRKLTYHSNILVVKDSANPENEGKVFRYAYGQSIFDMIKAKSKPEFEGEEPVNVFDFWEGCNLKLKARTEKGFVKYDRSEWEGQSVLSDNDEELDRVWSECHSLNVLIAPDQFKTYDELKNRLYVVLGLIQETTPMGTESGSDKAFVIEGDKIDDEIPTFEEQEEAVKSEEPTDDGDDEMAYFQKLAN